jgi:hypothetical protein
MKIYQILVGLFLTTCVFSCNFSDKKSSKNIEKMEFNINESLLGEQQIDSLLEIQFTPPKNWVNLHAKIEEINTLINGEEHIKVRNIYQDSLTGASLVVSDITNLNDSILNNIIANYETALNPNGNFHDIQKGEFVYNSFLVNQFVMQDPMTVVFKLLYLKGGKKRFQIDYILPRESYMENIQALESSIGSVNNLLSNL